MDQRNHCYKSMNDTEMYSKLNKWEFAVAERFIRTLRNKIYKFTTSISKTVSIIKLADVFNEYSNTYHTTIKMKSADLKSSM